MRDRSFRTALVATCCLLATVAARAEVSVTATSGPVSTTVMSIIEGPEPIGVMWQPFRSGAGIFVLNADGYTRGDGRPDVAYVAASGVEQRPAVVWAYNNGGEHDIAFAEWDGAAWTAVEFLTDGAADDLDPRLFTETDGTMYAVWWVVGVPERIVLAVRPSGAPTWQPAIVVGDGRRPSVAVLDGVMRVAFERDSALPGMAQEVAVIERDAGGAFIEVFAAATAGAEALDPVLHVRDGQIWLDWEHAR